jgi:hypothetical protein
MKDYRKKYIKLLQRLDQNLITYDQSFYAIKEEYTNSPLQEKYLNDVAAELINATRGIVEHELNTLD